MVKKGTIWLVVFIMFIMGLTLTLPPKEAQSEEVTQCEYAVALAERLGLGKGLSGEAAISALTRVGIMPKEGWKCGALVTPGFIAEIQGLVIMAAQKGLIPISPEDAMRILASLSDDLGLPRPPVVAVPPAPVIAAPPPPVGAGAGGGGGVASPSR